MSNLTRNTVMITGLVIANLFSTQAQAIDIQIQGSACYAKNDKNRSLIVRGADGLRNTSYDKKVVLVCPFTNYQDGRSFGQDCSVTEFETRFLFSLSNSFEGEKSKGAIVWTNIVMNGNRRVHIHYPSERFPSKNLQIGETQTSDLTGYRGAGVFVVKFAQQCLRPGYDGKKFKLTGYSPLAVVELQPRVTLFSVRLTSFVN